MTPDPTVTDARWPQIDDLDATADVRISPIRGWYAWGKGVFDYLFAVLLLVPALPLIAVGWVLVKLSSKGPGFYTQTRLGRDGKPYRILKLRSMTVHAEANGVQWAKAIDCRVTTVGKFLRATHLDELPQLFNVLAGEMSLVGPRPERPEMIRKKGLTEFVAGYQHRLLVKPGVTGLAQLQVPADTDITSVKHKVAYDLYYIENASLWFDLRLLAATLLKAAAVRPKWLRKLFFLPSRDVVADAFCANIASITSRSGRMRLYSHAQPA
jgi:lipopolysaccharide/colanic/teichoic acid biosynthesis glycosyltransferase